MSKTIGLADLAVAVSAAVASVKQKPEPLVVGLAPPSRAWPQAAAFAGARQPLVAPHRRDGAFAAKAKAAPFEGWRGNA